MRFQRLSRNSESDIPFTNRIKWLCIVLFAWPNPAVHPDISFQSLVIVIHLSFQVIGLLQPDLFFFYLDLDLSDGLFFGLIFDSIVSNTSS